MAYKAVPQVILYLLLCTFHFTVGEESNSDTINEGVKDVFDFKVNVKRLKREIREAPDEELSPVDGRTHRASDPLDPNKPAPAVNPFDEFETVNTIFEPGLEQEEDDNERPYDLTATTTQSVIEDNVTEKNDAVDDDNRNNEGGDLDDDVNNDDGDDDDDDDDDDDEREYAAQYPYPQDASNQYQSGGVEDASRPRFYPGDLDQPPYQRGVVEPYASNSQTRRQNQGYNSVSNNRRYQPESRPRARPEARGPAYNGQIYVDSQGHYVDEQGRHLDRTGRYYDVSGRYQDAAVTRTVSYYNNRPVYSQSSRGAGDQNSRYSGSRIPSRGAPLDSYGGNQFYQTGSGRYPVSYDPVVSQISDDPNCADMNIQVTINGLTCNNAVSQLGSYVCYNYERVSTECCQRCLQVKRAEREGCEYGDRSNQCRTMQPFNCYDARNRQICCDRCRQFLEQRGRGATIYQSREQLISQCSFDDLTPKCQNVRERPYLCYLPENKRLCCSTCPRLANNAEPGCQWGDQSPELCEPFDVNRRLKINCYIEAVRDICCSTCKSLRDRMPQRIPGCEYGDAPTLFRTGRGLLNCGEFIRQYGSNQCNSYQTSTKCCYTCSRYLNRRQGK